MTPDEVRGLMETTLQVGDSGTSKRLGDFTAQDIDRTEAVLAARVALMRRGMQRLVPAALFVFAVALVWLIFR